MFQRIRRLFVDPGHPAVAVASAPPEPGLRKEDPEKFQMLLASLARAAVSRRHYVPRWDGMFTTLAFREAVRDYFDLTILPERDWSERLLGKADCVTSLGGGAWAYSSEVARKENSGQAHGTA